MLKRIFPLAWGLLALLLAVKGAVAQSADSPQPLVDKTPRTDLYGDPLPSEAMARLGTVRLRHGDCIQTVVFSPDGKTLASLAKREEKIRLWDVATGREKGYIEGELHAMAFSADGRALTAITGQGVLGQWDLRGKKLRMLRKHSNSIFETAFSTDGSVAAAVDFDRVLLLWDAVTGEERLRLKGGTGLVPSLVLSHDGKVLASEGFSPDGATRVWDTRSGRELWRFKQAHRFVRPLALSPDGKILAASGEEEVVLYDVGDGKPIRSLAHHGPANTAAFTSDGSLLVTNPPQGISCESICLSRVADGKEIRRWTTADVIFSFAFSPDNKLLAAAGFHNTIRLFDVASGKEIHAEKGHVGPVTKVLVTADGRSVATIGADDTVRLWDAATGRPLRRFPLPNSSLDAAAVCSPDGRILATLVGAPQPAIHLWDLRTGAELRSFEVKGIFYAAIAFLPDGKTLVTSGDRGVVSVWDVATGKEVRSLRQKRDKDNEPGLPVASLTCSPDGRWLAASGGHGGLFGEAKIHLWDLTTGQGRPLHQQPAVLTSPTFSPDGKTLLVLEEPWDKRFGQNIVRLWEVESGRPRRLKLRGAGNVTAFALAPGGEVLATGEEPHRIRLWDIVTGEELRRFDGHRGEIASLAFSPDGRTLFSGSDDTTILLWDVSEIVHGRKRPTANLSPRQLGGLWRDLGGSDAARAGESIRKLIAGRQTTAFLRERLHPVVAPQAQLLTRLLADLDSADYAARERVMREFENLGEVAIPALRKALADHPSLEARRRIEQILARLPTIDIQVLRAIEALEHIGSREARQVLQTLAGGMLGVRLTEEAKQALKRLDKRSDLPP
jgi:WD40 repeat protein